VCTEMPGASLAGRARYRPSASLVICTAPTSPAGIRGLGMPMLSGPGVHVSRVVPHVAAELQVGRTVVRETPVLQRALGHLEHRGDLRLSLEPGSADCRCVHAHKVRRILPEQPVRHRAPAWESGRTYSANTLARVCGLVSGLRAIQAERRALKRVGILWRNPAEFTAGVPGLEPRTKVPETSVLPITPYPKALGRSPCQGSSLRDRSASAKPSEHAIPRGTPRARTVAGSTRPCPEAPSTRTGAARRGARSRRHAGARTRLAA
jgi:hypothetical protein